MLKDAGLSKQVDSKVIRLRRKRPGDTWTPDGGIQMTFWKMPGQIRKESWENRSVTLGRKERKSSVSSSLVFSSTGQVSLHHI